MGKETDRARKEHPQPRGIPGRGGVIAVAVIVLIFAGLGVWLVNRTPSQASPTEHTSTSTPTTHRVESPTPGSQPPGTTGPPQVGQRKTYPQPPPMTIDVSKTYTATITTPRGDIVIRLRPDLAPKTVNSFVFLANEGFYDGLTWHRVIEDFMAQGGDPTGTGMGGPGYTIPAEFTKVVTFDRPGIVAMARRGDDINSAGSQFFITTAPAPFLNEQYTIFGEVIEGQEIVNGIPLRDPQRASEPGEAMLRVRVEVGP